MDKLRKEALNKLQIYSKIRKDILWHAKGGTSKNTKYPKSSKFNKDTNHEVTSRKPKLQIKSSECDN